MTFKNQLITDMDIFFNGDEFAESAVYTPVSGDVVTCSVLIDRDVFIQADGYDTTVVDIGTTIDARVDEVGKPRKGSTFVVDSVTYTVARVESYDGAIVKCVVK